MSCTSGGDCMVIAIECGMEKEGKRVLATIDQPYFVKVSLLLLISHTLSIRVARALQVIERFQLPIISKQKRMQEVL